MAFVVFIFSFNKVLICSYFTGRVRFIMGDLKKRLDIYELPLKHWATVCTHGM